MTVYLPYGIICLVIAFVALNSFKRSSKNKKINRRNHNQERLQETLLMLKKAREKREQKSDEK